MTGDDEGRIKDKLIRVKQEWAKDGRLLTGRPDVGHVNRLPPGQREVKNWPVLDLGVQPNVEPRAWRLTVEGLVTNPMVWSLEEFMALPQEDFLSDIHCVTQWSRYDNRWRGVSARHLHRRGVDVDAVDPGLGVGACEGECGPACPTTHVGDARARPSQHLVDIGDAVQGVGQGPFEPRSVDGCL